jgi:N-acylneuraminate cytidylyltransferase
MITVVIPARAGSKRIQNKNIKHFHGKPLIKYPIVAARACKLVSEVVVSTDSEEIAEIATSAGADKIVFRPEKLADDYATTDEVMAHFVTNHETTFAMCIYPTTPLLTTEVITCGIEKFLENPNKLLISVTKNDINLERSFIADHLGNLKYRFPENAQKRTQELPVTFSDAGQFAIANSKNWITHAKSTLDAFAYFELDNRFVVDIDEERDWLKAEILYQILVTQKILP